MLTSRRSNGFMVVASSASGGLAELIVRGGVEGTLSGLAKSVILPWDVLMVKCHLGPC